MVQSHGRYSRWKLAVAAVAVVAAIVAGVVATGSSDDVSASDCARDRLIGRLGLGNRDRLIGTYSGPAPATGSSDDVSPFGLWDRSCSSYPPA